jgi:hypothetical protein
VVQFFIEPKEADLFLNDKLRKERRFSTELGNYKALISADGYKSDSIAFALSEKDSKRFHIKLEPTYGGLRLFPQPSTSTVKLFRKGKLVKESKGAGIYSDILAGEYLLELSHPDYGTKSKTIELIADKIITVELSLYE